jgi:methanogenic corrinoid protein MtbC1
MQHLMSMLSASAPPARDGLIMAACAPGETHQIGLLMLVVMLRWRGWDVMYLGPNLKLERLDESVGPLRPRVLLFAATRSDAADALHGLPEILSRFPQPAPKVVVGGQACDQGASRVNGFVYLNDTLSETVNAVEQLMEGGPELRQRLDA